MTRLLGLLILLAAPSSASAALISYVANLNGPAESPPNTSPGTGAAQLDYDSGAHTLRIQFSFSGLLGVTTAFTINSATAAPNTGTAGVAIQIPTASGSPFNVTGGSYDQTFNTLSPLLYNSAYVTSNGGTVAGAEQALINGLNANEAYFNIRTSVFPVGEIRGFFAPSAVPEPSSLVLLGLGTLGLVIARSQRGGRTEK